MAWKYIIMRVGNREVPVIFPEDMVHRLMKDAVAAYFTRIAVDAMPPELKGEMTFKKLKEMQDQMPAVAAGTITIDVGSCTGHSETLGVGAREHDAAFISSYNYHHGHLEGEWRRI